MLFPSLSMHGCSLDEGPVVTESHGAPDTSVCTVSVGSGVSPTSDFLSNFYAPHLLQTCVHDWVMKKLSSPKTPISSQGSGMTKMDANVAPLACSLGQDHFIGVNHVISQKNVVAG